MITIAKGAKKQTLLIKSQSHNSLVKDMFIYYKKHILHNLSNKCFLEICLILNLMFEAKLIKVLLIRTAFESFFFKIIFINSVVTRVCLKTTILCKDKILDHHLFTKHIIFSAAKSALT
jgi:hypothetical protein